MGQVAGLGLRSGPLLTRSPGPVPAECHHSRRAGLARTHSPPSNSLSKCAASFCTTRAVLENCPKVKRDFFPADVAPADPSPYLPLPEQVLFISLPKKKKSKPQTEKQVGPFQDLAGARQGADK